MEPKVIYEDKNFLAIDKPAGLLVHEARNVKHETSDVSSFPLKADPPRADKLQASSDEPTLVDWLLKNYPEVKDVGDSSAGFLRQGHSTPSGLRTSRDERPRVLPSIKIHQNRRTSGLMSSGRPGIVHRLDRETSGVMLVARNQDYFEYLKRLFKEHKIKKTYLALAVGRIWPARGVIDKPIRIKNGTIKRTVFLGKAEKAATTEYQVKNYVLCGHAKNLDGGETEEGGEKIATIITRLCRNDSKNCPLWLSLLEVSPKTGRTHQIRVHLASIGHPVLGDRLYGSRSRYGQAERLMLHALALEFETEPGKRIRIEAEPPREFNY